MKIKLQCYLLFLSIFFSLGLNAIPIPFGYNAISLGKPVLSEPSLSNAFARKDNCVVIDKFFHIGGYNTLFPQTDARLFWDEKSLYMIFACEDPSPNRGIKPRDDKMALYINLDNEEKKYYEFSVSPNGISKGKFFLKTDSFAIISTPKAEIKFDQNKWYGKLTIPWTSMGGKPQDKFGLLIVRHRQQNDLKQSAQLSSPVALDFANPIQPGMYLEASFGNTAKLIQTGKKALTELPSGKLHWQRPALLVMPDEKERVAIWQMQEVLNKPTAKENFTERIHLTQRWLDMLVLEGYIFAAAGSLWQIPVATTPWEARNAINIALYKNDFTEAYRVLDVLLKQLDSMSRFWYADESPGNILKNRWTKLDKITNIVASKYSINLYGIAGKHNIILSLTNSSQGGIRIHSESKGYFNADTLAFSRIDSSQGIIRVTGKNVIANITKGDQWSIVVMDTNGKEKWKIKKGDLSFYFKDNKTVSVDISNNLTESEAVYGFGERFDVVNQRNNILQLYVFDCDESNFRGIFNNAYKVIPLVHSSSGYSIFLNSSYHTRADIGNQQKDRLRYTFHGPVLDLYIWPGSPKNGIAAFTNLTGKPILPPRWAFEPWMGDGGEVWGADKTRTNSEQAINVVRRFAALDIPHSAFYAEGAESPALYAGIKPYGIRNFSWTPPFYIKPKEAMKILNVAEADLPHVRKADGSLLSYPDGYQLISWLNPQIDFFHPNSMKLMRLFWKDRLDMGVSGSMVDFAELITNEISFYNGKKGDEMHNSYCLEYHRSVNKVFTERRKDDFVLFSRAAAPGSQEVAGQFAGDHQSNYYGLTAVIKGLINISTTGFSNWGSDIGGYIGFADEEMYNRWVQFGAFSPFMRCHGIPQPREPWVYSDSTVRIYKKFAWLRENILDYTYSNSVNANHTGIPMIQAMQIAYPEQSELKNCDDQYLFGNDMLVAPLHAEGESRQVIFPAGKWVNIWNNKIYAGAKQKVDAPLNEIPVFLKEGALIPAELDSTFTLGKSMTNNKLKVIIATAPAKESSTAFCWKNESEKATLSSTAENNGFIIRINDRPDTDYLIIYGVAGKISNVKINNEETSLSDKSKLRSITTGWYEDKTGRIIIRLPYRFTQEIKIFYK